MGNRICGVGRRGAVEERLTQPQRLPRQLSNVDYRKLRKLILSQKLAPCFDGLDDPGADLEECPICFFFYPSLNRSRCCAKGICTECFLQMKPANATRPAQCPFCKTSCYAVEYRGARTKLEKELELAEEQKVIEARIRMQSQESQNVEQAVAADRSCSLPDDESLRPCLDERSFGDLVTRDSAVPSAREEIGTDSSLAPNICNSRFEEWDIDLEEIMVMEAIWQSLQDSKSKTNETPEASESCGGGILNRGDRQVNQSRSCPSLDQYEASSSDACPLPRLVKDDSSQLEVLERICDVSRASCKPCEDSTEESDGPGTGMGCFEDCYFQEDEPSWRSAQLVETLANTEVAVFAREVCSSSAEAETRSCCPSYLHSGSSSPCDSPAFSNPGGGRGFAQLPGMILERPMMIVTESNA